MELQQSELNTIENIIEKTGIPYEGVKVELIDHLASAVELKMADNPKLTFEEALSKVGYNMKETLIHIKAAITKKTIKVLINNSLDFSNWMSISVIIFFTSAAYVMLFRLGVYGAPVGLSFILMTLIAMFIMNRRLKRIDVGYNYKLVIKKDYAWVPLIAVGSLCFATAAFFQVINNTHFFHNNIMKSLIILPIAFSFGLFIKVILDVTVFNVRQLREHIEIDNLFDFYNPASFELN